MRSSSGASRRPWPSASGMLCWPLQRSRKRRRSVQAEANGGVLFVHAHPDDESMGTGGTIARLVAEGVRVDLVTCTDGAEGEIHDPTLDHDEARPRLASIRAAELACSVDALGGGAIIQHLLDYRDSWMTGTDANVHPYCFSQAESVAASRLAS